MFGVGPGEACLIVLLLVFFFGAKRVPEIGESIGKAIRGYKTARWGTSPTAESSRNRQQPDIVK